MTVPCIGWLADPPCPVHGITHGCRWPEGHTGGRHECICGATCRRQVERVSPKRCVSVPHVSERDEPGAAQTAPAPARRTLEVPPT